jgi:AcrR family transcriptional regulator
MNSASAFPRDGDAETTIADIAAASGVSTRTFFAYYATEEELLFSASDDRVAASVSAIASREPGDRPADVLLRTLTRPCCARG